MASPDKKAFLLRVSPELWAELERLAAAELRSLNGQVEFMLREAVAQRIGKPAARPAQSSAPKAQKMKMPARR